MACGCPRTTRRDACGGDWRASFSMLHISHGPHILSIPQHSGIDRRPPLAAPSPAGAFIALHCSHSAHAGARGACGGGSVGDRVRPSHDQPSDPLPQDRPLQRPCPAACASAAPPSRTKSLRRWRGAARGESARRWEPAAHTKAQPHVFFSAPRAAAPLEGAHAAQRRARRRVPLRAP